MINKVLNVTMYQLCRIANGLRGDGLHALGVQGVARLRGQNHPKTQLGEEGKPEGVVLVHVEDARNPDRASGGLVLGQGFVVVKAPLVLVVVEVGQFHQFGR